MASIGDLVANLTVDNRGFTKGLKDSRSQLGSFVGSVTTMVAPIAGALAAVWGTSASLAGARESLENQQRLSAVLAATGNAAGLTTEEIVNYAGELQSLTNFEGDATVAAAALLASFSNIRGDNFKQALAVAQDMATVMDIDVSAAVKKIGKELRDLKPEQVGERLAAMQARFGGAAQAVADPWRQLQNTLGDVGENIGSVLLPSVTVLSGALNGMLSVVADGATTFVEFGIESAVVLSNMGGLLTVAMTQWQLFFVKTGLDAAHFFTTAMPEYLTWFGKNWSSVMLTAVDYASTIFINLGENIRNLWKSVVDFFSGNPVQFDWKPLTEGFKNSIADLPDIPERMTTEFEKSLQNDISAMTDHVAKEMDKQRADLTKRFNPSTPSVAMTMPEPAKQSGQSTELKAAFKGSQEAAAIATRGSSLNKLENYAAKQLAETQKQTKAIQDNKPGTEEVADF